MKTPEKTEDLSTQVSKVNDLDKSTVNTESIIPNQEDTGNNKSSDKDFTILPPQSKIKKKKEIIVKLRVLVDGNEDQDTFNKVKSLQDLWKQIG